LVRQRTRRKVDYGEPVVLTCSMLSSWRVKIPRRIWEKMQKDENRLEAKDIYKVINILADNFPRGWRLHRVKQNCIYVVKEPIPKVRDL
jgi:hypothetical protein